MLSTLPAPADLDAERPDRAREARRLRLFLEQAQGFEFAIAIYSRADTVEPLIAETMRELADAGLPVLQIDLRGQDDQAILLKLLMQALATALAGGETVRGVFVTGLEGHLDYVQGGIRSQTGPLLATANLQRDVFPSRCPVPVVLWASALAQPAIARLAPDLWHWRRATFDFTEGAEPHALTLDRAIPRPDRDFDRLPAEDLRRRLAMLSELERELGDDPGTLSEVDRSWLARLVIEKAETLWHLGEVEPAQAAFECGLDLARAAGIDSLVARAWSGMADIRYLNGDYDQALRIRQEEELPVYQRLGDVRATAVTMGQIADILQARGELDQALRIRHEEQLPVYQRLGDVRATAVTMGQIADILQARGELDQALRIRHEEQLPVYQRLGDVRETAVTMGQIADTLQARGELDQALRIRREEELPVYERLGDVREKAVTMGKIADILQTRGDLDEALRILSNEVKPAFERLGAVREKTVTMGHIGHVLERQGNLDAARQLQLACLEEHKRLGDVDGVAATLWDLARLDRAEGKHEDMAPRLVEAFALLRKLGRAEGLAVVGEALGRAKAEAGERDQAREALEISAAAYRKLGRLLEAAAVEGLLRDP